MNTPFTDHIFADLSPDPEDMLEKEDYWADEVDVDSLPSSDDMLELARLEIADITSTTHAIEHLSSHGFSAYLIANALQTSRQYVLQVLRADW